ncbi:MAG: biopolymer transporter ExbD [Mariprofundales bacterium]|nr:biopolymer transporter ExbD [Mariprofundales bacterium]
MQFEGARRSAQIPNMTPLIDIVFLLLIFFMLTAHFVRDEGIAIQLPQAETAVAQEDDTALIVLLDRDGNIRLNDTIVAPHELESSLRSELRNRNKKWVTLRGDRASNLGSAVTILDAARKAGAQTVDVVTEHP